MTRHKLTSAELENLAPAAPGRKKVRRVDGSVVTIPTEPEMLERRKFVRELHAAGVPTSQIAEAAATQFGVKHDAIVRLVGEIRADLKREYEAFAPQNRAAARERLYDHLMRLNSELAVMRQSVKKDWAAIRGHVSEVRQMENQIAKLEGTLEPIRIEHSGELNINLQRAVTTMTPAQVAQAVDEEEARMRLAAGSITTTATDADPSPQQPTPAALTQPRRRPALPAPGPPGVLDHSAQASGADATRRERSSDVAARRQVLSPMDAHVGERAPGRGVSARVIP